MVRILLALLTLITTHGRGRAILAGPAGAMAQAAGLAPPATAGATPAASPAGHTRRSAGEARRCSGRGPRWPARRPGRVAAPDPAARPAGPAPLAPAHPDHRGRGARTHRPDLPQGHRVRGPGGAVRRPAHGGAQRAPAQRPVRVALAGHRHGHHHEHRPRSLGPAEDRGHLPARPRPGELRFLLHPQGLQEHRAVALLVRQHLLRGRARIRHRGPEPGTERGGPGPRGTTGSRCSAVPRAPGPAT